MTSLTPAPRASERGYSLVALLAAVTVMLTMMAMAVPSWKYISKNEKEEELIFRGGQIADAVARYQRKNGGGMPVSMEVLVKGKYLRRAYKDPMVTNGQWRFVRPGEPLPWMIRPGQGGTPGQSGPGGAPGPGGSLGQQSGTQGGLGPGPTGEPGGSLAASPQLTGPFVGVASVSREKSLRVFNGREKYNEWIFVAGQPRMVGEFPAPGSAPLSGPSGVQSPTAGRPGGGGLPQPPRTPPRP